jgi:DEAD/DEAH box helicase domain-containing protein
MGDVIVYDLEIEKDIEEVGGWDAAAKGAAGISCASSYSYATGEYSIWFRDNYAGLREQLNSASLVVGFNHMRFDNNVVHSVIGDLAIKDNYDILRQVQKACGGMHKGYKLTDLCSRTLGARFIKSMSGEFAPQLFKEHRIGQLAHYCQRDVFLTRKLFEFIIDHGYVISAEERKLPVGPPDRFLENGVICLRA